jgi:hypothetical protein
MLERLSEKAASNLRLNSKHEKPESIAPLQPRLEQYRPPIWRLLVSLRVHHQLLNELGAFSKAVDGSKNRKAK